MKPLLTILLVFSLFPCRHPFAAESGPPNPEQPSTETQTNQPVAAVRSCATIQEREKAVFEAATADPQALAKTMSPMRFWIAQHYFEQGEEEQALAIVKRGVKEMRTATTQPRAATT